MESGEPDWVASEEAAEDTVVPDAGGNTPNAASGEALPEAVPESGERAAAEILVPESPPSLADPWGVEAAVSATAQ